MAIGNRRPGTVVPGVGFVRGVVVDPAVVAVLIGFVLGTGSVFILPGIVAVGAGFGISAQRTGIARKRVILPSAVTPSGQHLTAGVTLSVIRMLI